MLITNHPDRQHYVRLHELMALDAFKNLSSNHQRFVVHYVHEGLKTGVYDAVAATTFAYGEKIKSTNTRAYQLLKSNDVRRILDVHFRRSGMESIVADLRKAAKRSVKLGLGLTPETIRALKMFEDYVDAQANAQANTVVAKEGNENVQS